MKKIYTIIAGVNGTGKSSFTGALKAQDKALGVIVDTDKIMAENHLSPIEGGKEAIRKISFCLENGLNFTQETTLSGNYTKKTIKKAKEKGYYIRLFYLALDSAEESIRRINNRVMRGGHDIPQELTTRRFLRRWEELASVLLFCDEVKLFDNNNGFMEVATFENGELIRRGSIQSDWLNELEEYLM